VRTTSNFIHQLIHSLTKNEKGYFVKLLKIHGGNPKNKKYFSLFSAIDKQTIYNELAIINQFKDETFIKQFSVAKNYLIEIILKSLIQYNGTKTIENVLSKEIDTCNILSQKGFIKAYQQNLSKVKEKSILFEKHDFTLTIIKKEKELLVNLKDKNFKKNLQKLLDEESKILEDIKIENQLSKYYYILTTEIHQNRIIRNEKEIAYLFPIINSLHKDFPKFKNSFSSKNYYYGIHIIYNYLVNDFKKAEEFGLLHEKLFLQNPLLAKQKLDDFMEISYHFIGAKFQIGKYDKIELSLKKIYNLEVETNELKQKKFFIYYSNMMRFYASTYQYKKAEQLLTDFNKELPSIIKHLSISNKLTLFLNSSILQFALGNYDVSLEYLNAYFEIADNSFRKDAFKFALIFNLFIHFKLGNLQLLENLLKNIKQSFRKEKQIFLYEKILIDFLSKAIGNINKKDKIKLMKKTKIQLEEIKIDIIQKDAMRYFNFPRWFESQILQIPYKQMPEYLEKLKAGK
jgi:hypothetical protein